MNYFIKMSPTIRHTYKHHGNNGKPIQPLWKCMGINVESDVILIIHDASSSTCHVKHWIPILEHGLLKPYSKKDPIVTTTPLTIFQEVSASSSLSTKLLSKVSLSQVLKSPLNEAWGYIYTNGEVFFHLPYDLLYSLWPFVFLVVKVTLLVVITISSGSDLL